MSDIASTPNYATQIDLVNSSPFEGPEKLLEIWFGPAADEPSAPSAKLGLRAVNRKVWEDMLDIVRCKVLNMIEGTEVDAYLLSESSLFVFSHKVILKTCGTTLNLLGLPRILDIAATHCGLKTVYRFFYSRKSFMFPERQQGPHREWRAEVEYLDNIFGGKRGAAYTVGKVNGDHWLLYLTNPSDDGESANSSDIETDVDIPITPVALDEDYTLEILMTKLSCDARSAFFFPTTESESDSIADAQSRADVVSHKLGIDSLFPASMTTLDAFAFTPCGYSANALLRPAKGPEGYYTIHVTPEEGWSFASFECNVPLSHYKTSAEATKVLPDLRTLIQRVVQIFQPGHLSLTLFMTSPNPPFSNGHVNGLPNGKEQALMEAPVDSAHRAFKEALTSKGYKRTDKINYEFGGYDLAFASFEAR
ncbi:S-adenosylmethionine decarboxylase [Hysterangium stoloniferum]|nr:S-adenosylmethionine decarboxylase [Hysterangium stoloniferum]